MSAVENGLPLTAPDRVVHSVAPADNRFAFRISRPEVLDGSAARSYLTDKESPQVWISGAMGMTTTRFREGGVEDATVIFDCLKALATEEGHLINFRLTATKLRDILSRQPNGVHVLLCENGHRLVGLAMWSERFSAYSGGAIIWLHDFYIVQASRREGVGHRLVNELRRIAQTRNYQRIEWYIHCDNDSAKLFYKSVGGFKAEHIESWRLEST